MESMARPRRNAPGGFGWSHSKPPESAAAGLSSLAAVAAAEPSPRREPWVDGQKNRKAPAGAKERWIRRAAMIHRTPRRRRGIMIIGRSAAGHVDRAVVPMARFCRPCRGFRAIFDAYPRLAPSVSTRKR